MNVIKLDIVFLWLAIAVAILYQSHANQACLNLDLTVERACNDHRLLCEICITATYSISVSGQFIQLMPLYHYIHPQNDHPQQILECAS